MHGVGVCMVRVRVGVVLKYRSLQKWLNYLEKKYKTISMHVQYLHSSKTLHGDVPTLVSDS